MDVKFYMEYKESQKALEEMYDAFYKYKNSKRPGIFKMTDIREKSREKAEERHKELRKTYRKDRTVKAEFYDDHFVCTSGDMIQKYQYEEIEGLYETDMMLVFLAGKKRKKESFVALKKGSVKGKSLADLKQYLLERCTKVSNGIVKL